MLSFSYTLSPTLKKELENIDITRNKLLIELVSPKREIRLRFENQAKCIASILFIEGKVLSMTDILRVTTSGRAKNNTEAMVIDMKSANEYVRHNWLLSDEKIRSEEVSRLFFFFKDAPKIEKAKIAEALDFILVNPEHPIIQAGLSFLLISQLLPQANNRIKLSGTVSSLFLYKYGYDFRGMLNLQEYFAQDLTNFHGIIKKSSEDKNISAFLEYFVQAVSIQGEKALDKIRTRLNEANNDTSLDLTERQKNMLSMFDTPDVKITNRAVQKAYKISQITASRDLAKLSTLGLIVPHGKGRSVNYTKA